MNWDDDMMDGPHPDDKHYPFWKHILEGGSVCRNDPINGVVNEILNFEKLGGDAGNIYLYGYMDLEIIPDEVFMVFELLTGERLYLKESYWLERKERWGSYSSFFGLKPVYKIRRRWR